MYAIPANVRSAKLEAKIPLVTAKIEETTTGLLVRYVLPRKFCLVQKCIEDSLESVVGSDDAARSAL